jgi:hypothetical protein
MDQRNYPDGRTPFYSKYVDGILKFFTRSGAAEFFSIDGTGGVAYEAGKTYSVRNRATIAEINAGKALVAAVPGYKIRMVSASAIAYGGAAAAVTTVDILGTQATSSVKLAAFAQASLTQSARLEAGDAGAAVLADGASFAVCDVNTGITINKTGSAITTATGVDIQFTYELVRA